MKTKTYFLSLVILLTAFAGCKKDRQKPDGGNNNSNNISTVNIAGKDYQAIKIGNLTWLSVNYDGAGGVSYPGTRPEYGKYYTYQEIQAISLPSGWRIPTVQDFINLAQSNSIVIDNYNAKGTNIRTLTSKTNWKTTPGTNASGFNAHPGGYVFDNGAPLDGDIAEFWTADGKTFSIQEAGADALRITFYGNSNNALYRFNLRLVKDN